MGEVSCDKDGVLFYTNGSQAFEKQAQCNAIAKWDGIDDLECWNGILNVFPFNYKTE